MEFHNVGCEAQRRSEDIYNIYHQPSKYLRSLQKLTVSPNIARSCFLVGYDERKMLLKGSFSYEKENQRTLPFNVDIVNLPQYKTVFTGSSSESHSNIRLSLLELSRNLREVSQSMPSPGWKCLLSFS